MTYAIHIGLKRERGVYSLWLILTMQYRWEGVVKMCSCSTTPRDKAAQDAFSFLHLGRERQLLPARHCYIQVQKCSSYCYQQQLASHGGSPRGHWWHCFIVLGNNYSLRPSKSKPPFKWSYWLANKVLKWLSVEKQICPVLSLQETQTNDS